MHARALLATRLGRLMALGVVVATLATTSVASADHHLEPRSDDSARSRVETGSLIAGVLAELGLGADDVALLVGDLREGVSHRVSAMIDEGVVTPDQVESLGELLTDGTFGVYVPAFVDETRIRRDVFRTAALAALAHLGIEVPDGTPVEDVLRANNLTPPELKKVLDELGIDLPPPPPPHHGPRHEPPPDNELPAYPMLPPAETDALDPSHPPPYPTSDGSADGDEPPPPPPTSSYPTSGGTDEQVSSADQLPPSGSDDDQPQPEDTHDDHFAPDETDVTKQPDTSAESLRAL